MSNPFIPFDNRKLRYECELAFINALYTLDMAQLEGDNRLSDADKLELSKNSLIEKAHRKYDFYLKKYGYGYAAPVPTEPIKPRPVWNDARTFCDVELGRLAYALDQFNPYRMWEVIRAKARANNQTYIVEKDLYAALRQYGIGYDTAKRLLPRGEGIFWRRDTKTRRIYHIGYRAVSLNLTQMAITRGKHALVTTNRPGVKQIRVDLSGTQKQAAARLYAAWHSLSNKVISRKVLGILWNTSTPTLLDLEKTAKIKKTRHYSQHAIRGGAIVRQRPNLYKASFTEEHQSKKTPRSTRYAVNTLIENADQNLEAISMFGQAISKGSDGLNPTGRLYFEGRNSRSGYTSSHKSLGKHLAWHGDLDRAHYAVLGYRKSRKGDVMVSDYSPDGQQRTTMGQKYQRCKSQEIFDYA